IVRLRQVTPAHLEEYKLRRLNGRIHEVDDDGERKREAQLRSELGQRSSSRQANAKFGWLGRKRLKPSIAPRTVNYELQVLRTFFQWAVRRNHLIANPASIIE